MTTLREAAQQALEALEKTTSYDIPPISQVRSSITALRAALAQEEDEPCTYRCEAWPECWCADLAKPEQKPVAWTATRLWNRKELWTCPADIERDLLEGYAHPPRREWKGLSEGEIYSHWHGTDWRESVFVRLPAFARAIELALKERNHE